MAATTAKLIQLRPICRPSTTGSIAIQLFSSSSSTPDPNEDTPQTNSNSPPPPPPKSPPSYSSLFDDVKARLKQQQGSPQSQPPRAPSSFFSAFPTSNAPSFKIRNREEIERNLSEFRSRSAVPPPPPDGSATKPPQHFSFEEIYRRNVASSGEESSSAGSKYFGKPSVKDIAESLRSLRATAAKKQNERSGKNYDGMSLANFKKTLKMEPGDQSGRDSTRVIGGSDNLPPSIFGKEMGEKDGGSANADTKRVFQRMYSHVDLGKMLKSLRPEKRGDWFSLQELNERLMTLRVTDQKEAESDSNVGVYNALRGSLMVMKEKAEKPKKPMPTVELFRLGRTPSFMLAPPQDHLVEKYFHPDNMSASEKLKLELKKVRDEFKMSESDCGSARVQVAQLTTKIKHLSTVLHKKDKHSKKGLQGMVQKRKTLLKYLRRTDWESYCFVLSKLGLRDNPDYKN